MSEIMQPLEKTFFQRGAGDTRTRVKICGLTTEEDARDAIALGADALGFNLFTGSKRYIDLKNASGWIAALPDSVAKVAVMVNPTLAEAEAVANLPYIDAVQLHGHEDAAFCAAYARLGLPFIKAVAVKDAASLAALSNFATPYMLVDSWSPSEFGGTGKTIDADLLKPGAIPSDIHLILSGGLNPENVGAAVARLRPYAVDVASGVEFSPGRKNRDKVAAFIKAAIGQNS